MNLSTACSNSAILCLVLLVYLPLVPGSVTGVSEGPPVSRPIRIAVMPVERLTPKKAPYKEIRESFTEMIASQGGVSILNDEELEGFILRHRIRYTGGVDVATARALRQEEGVDAVLITSLEFYDDDTYPPKVAILSRLVSTDEEPSILWMDAVSLGGEDSPGILGIGLIADIVVLREKALKVLADSLALYLSGRGEPGSWKTKERYGPKIVYRAPYLQVGEKYSVAVVPFFNSTLRRNAGEILSLHFLKELVQQGNLRVVEPGVIRTRLLNFRVVMLEGLSLLDADAILQSLGSDLALSGRVIDYGEYSGETAPRVDFSVVVLERMSRRVVWMSKSYNDGGDGVFFFDVGRVNTAGALASKMTRLIVDKMFGGPGTVRPEGAKGAI